MNKKITIIIVTYKTNLQTLENCLNSIDKNINIVVIENSKKFKNEKSFIKKYKNLKIFCAGSNLGYAKGNNYGLKKITTKYALILNPDTICQKNFFKNINETIKNAKEFHVIGCQYSEKFLNKQAGFFNNNSSIRFNNLTKVDWVKGFSLLLNIKKFKTKKIFDENYFLFFEEIDLCKKVKKNKGKIYLNKKIIINHEGASSVSKSNAFELEKNRNWHWMWSTFYYQKKYKGLIVALIIISPKFFSSLIKTLFYLLILNHEKKDIYYCRLSGIFNSILGKKSWYRPSLD